MNYLVFAAGIVSLFAVIGHFAMGNKMYLQPVMESGIDLISKKVMQSLFHYMSVFMVVSTIILLGASLGSSLIFADSSDIILLIGLIYGGFAITQFIIALRSSVKMGIAKMFQWIFWLIIAVFSIFGAI